PASGADLRERGGNDLRGVRQALLPLRPVRRRPHQPDSRHAGQEAGGAGGGGDWMTLCSESSVLTGWVALFVLFCLDPGLVAVTPHNRLRRILRVSGVRDGQLTEQES